MIRMKIKKMHGDLNEIDKFYTHHDLNDFDKRNAHLALAATASKLESINAKNDLVANLLEVMSQSETPQDFEYHLHALSNAGEAVPLEFYSAILSSPLHVQGKEIAVNALANRLSEDGEEETTAFIHSVLSSNLDEAIKVTAVKAQTAREHILQNAASVLEFKQYLDSVDSASALSKALNEYYEEAGVSVSSVNDVNTLDVHTLGWFRRFFRRIGNSFRRAFRAVGNFVKKSRACYCKSCKKSCSRNCQSCKSNRKSI